MDEKAIQPPKARNWNELTRKEQDKAIRDELDAGKLLLFEAKELSRTLGVMNQLYMNEQMLRQRLADVMYELNVNNRALAKLGIKQEDYGKAFDEIQKEDQAQYETQQLGLVPRGAKDLKEQAKSITGTGLVGLDGKPMA